MADGLYRNRMAEICRERERERERERDRKRIPRDMEDQETAGADFLPTTFLRKYYLIV